MSHTETRVTLVLGAGASAPYGFPTGQQLIQAFIGEPIDGQPNFSKGMYDFECDGIDSSQWHPNTDELVHSIRYGRPQSIDQFLETKPKFSEIAKYAVARCILLRQAAALRDGRLADGWYRYLFDKVIRPHWRLRCRLQVVTFNYDRSFELAMLQMYHHRYDAQAKMSDLLNAIPIVHVYGELSHAPHDDRVGWPGLVDATVPLPDCLAASKGIVVVSEDRKKAESRFTEARRYIEDSQCVYFLGFGFDPTNSRRLGLLSDARLAPHPPVKPSMCATTFGLTELESSVVARRLGFQTLHYGQPYSDGQHQFWRGEFVSQRCEEMLRAHSILPELGWSEED